ncbi:MAG: metallophosphoesterase [Peptoniphilaceae bacterium]|nr:metallophosphoesterase [Peptoniphilaceae bacterium]MDY6018420.1 metallophosphoesterase [Anaerococcus sp.]
MSDCHLASANKFSSNISDFIRKKTWESFENILKDNKDLDFALIGGDLFERSFFTTRDYQKLFKIIRDFGKNVYYVTGNHDYISYDNQLFFEEKPNNLKIFSSAKLDFYQEEKTRIYGISYEDRIFTQNFPYDLKLDKSYFNILLVHGAIGEKNSNYLNLDLNKVKAMGFNYVALGHIHKPEKLSYNIYYSGTTEAKDFSENMDYGYLLYDEGKIQRKEVSKLKFTDISLKSSDFSDLNDLVTYLKTILSNKINFLRLNLKLDRSFKLDEEKIKNDLNLFYLEINVEKDYDFAKLVKAYPDSLLTRFLYQVDTCDKDHKILERAKELGLDAILRSLYE